MAPVLKTCGSLFCAWLQARVGLEPVLTALKDGILRVNEILHHFAKSVFVGIFRGIII